MAANELSLKPKDTKSCQSLLTNQVNKNNETIALFSETKVDYSKKKMLTGP